MSTNREKILQKLNPKFLKVQPKLSGDVGSFIDLDSDESLTGGAKELMIRFFKNKDLCEKSKRNSVQKETELTISTAKYNGKNEVCELITEKLRLPFENNDDDVCETPGRSLQKLKIELQEKISAKWEEEYRKRVNKNKSYSEFKCKNGKKYSKADEIDNEEGSGVENESENDEDGSNQEKTSQSKSVEEELEDEMSDPGDEADVEFDDDDDDDGGEEDDYSNVASNDGDKQLSNSITNQDNFEKDEDYEGCSLIPAYQPGGGMLYGGSELTQGDEALPQNLLSPSLRFSIGESPGSKLSESLNEQTPKKPEPSPNEESENLFTTKTKLFSQNSNCSFDLNDAFEFCSGKFPDAQEKTEVEVEKENLDNPESDENEDSESDHEKDDDDDGDDKFINSLEDELSADKSENQTSKSKRFQNIIVFDESEEEEEVANAPDKVEETQSVPSKILSDDEDDSTEKPKTRTKKTWKGLHFSDDEDGSTDCKGEENNQEDEQENSDEDVEDSEKDEGDEEDQRSVHYDSEENEINPKEFFEKEAELSGSEWSGDEDERGLDEFDAEEGDADCLDDDQVRSQLEKIHIRRVLDDDAREVRYIQEILFEDGDLQSDGKGRDRKFKWKNLGTFEQDNEDNTKEEAGKDSEDDGGEEEELRKIRHEKELFLMAKKKDGELSSDDEIVEDFHSVKVTTVKNFAPAKDESKFGNAKSVACITEIAKATNFSSARGSFLTRNEEFLSRLAKATSNVSDNILGPKNSKNFVFTTKSPEKENPERNVISKRQIEDAESFSRREKKLRLIPPEVKTGPSILDLLV